MAMIEESLPKNNPDNVQKRRHDLYKKLTYINGEQILAKHEKD